MKHSIFRRSGSLVLSTGLSLLAVLSVARADSVYTSAGFEPPTFVPMLALDGQNGWLKDGGSSTATISTNSPKSSLQSLQILKAANSTANTRWSIGSIFTPSSTLNAVCAEVDMRVNISASNFGPAFGLETRDGNKLIGAFSFDAATGEVLYVESGTGKLRSTGRVLSRGVYHHLQLLTDFANKLYSISADNVVLHTEPFINGTATALTSTSIAAYSVNPATAASESGVAYLDNFDVTSRKVDMIAPNVTVPAAPTYLRAQGGKGQITLDWGESSGTTLYNIYRGSNAGAETLYRNNISGTSYTNSGIEDGVTYFYKVSASNSAGESAQSEEASATTAAPDLLIEGLIANPSAPGVGDSVVLNATITNNSFTTTASNQTVTFYDDSALIGSDTIAALAPGESTTVQVTWTPQSAGDHKLSANTSLLSKEINSDNNSTASDLTVYNYYTYTTKGTLVGNGKVEGNSQSKWYKYPVGVAMNAIKEVRVIGLVTTYDDSGSVTSGQASPSLESFIGDGRMDTVRVGDVTPTGVGNWVMSSENPLVTSSIKPMMDNYIDLYINGLNATSMAQDQVKLSGITVQIKYLAP